MWAWPVKSPLGCSSWGPAADTPASRLEPDHNKVNQTLCFCWNWKSFCLRRWKKKRQLGGSSRRSDVQRENSCSLERLLLVFWGDCCDMQQSGALTSEQRRCRAKINEPGTPSLHRAILPLLQPHSCSPPPQHAQLTHVCRTACNFQGFNWCKISKLGILHQMLHKNFKKQK